MSLWLNNDSLLGSLSKHGFDASRDHLSKADAAKINGDLQTARSELQLFLESLIDAIRDRLKGDEATFPIFENFDWKTSMRGLRSGLPDDEDWKTRWWLTLLFAEVVVQRFEQRLN
jgi:hypothetical protein